ncbi:radical SAM protein [Polyangium sp. y55x31]|uniref:radical SAM protein n=1 Tax=Polyangium sp. y55x31 TaxID=3042688 RepID=UPI002482B5FF|nr:radical SAM protein [Polyangium sp. y55x31]MDI1481621.1 radical SAM protein [Polyangium sp. y55x31]
MPPWSRPEPFGAWVRLDDRTLVAVDHALAARLGVPVGQPADAPAPPRPLEVHLAVNARCHAPCADCYLDARPDGAEPSLDELRARLVTAAELGASTVAFGGGEPLLREDLGALAAFARSLGLVPVMTTSGFGLREERAKELRAFAQINVSHDGVGGAYAAVRGFDGARVAERAIEVLARAKIPVGVNLVLTRRSFEHLDATAERVADLGAGELQLLRYKPQGRAAGIGYFEARLSAAQREALWPAITAIVHRRRLSVRIDCALVPLLSEALAEEPRAAEILASLGVFGCEAGRYLGALDVAGRAAPCSFSPSSSEEIDRFRAYHAAPPEPCASCTLFPVCRGGCQVVSRHAGGSGAQLGLSERSPRASTANTFRPDPECPRVRRDEASS